MLTNTMMPLMSKGSYARIIFTVSAASYYTGATNPLLSALDAYAAGKAALRTYASNLGAALNATSIRVSTVNPYVMNTALAAHPNPIYTRPVNANGLTGDLAFDQVLGLIRAALAGGLPPAMVGETYAQLLSMTVPPSNVVVGSPDLASQGQNDLIEGSVLAENGSSAIPFVGA
jgi:short-subunit dehydrogenase